jgi:hypothetical protein
MTHVFISYARRDERTYANNLYAALQKAGRQTWLDRRGIDPARDFTAEIETAIRAASHVVACITPDTERADSFVRRELQYALMVDKPILVARVDEAAIPPIHVVNNTFIEFYKDWDGGVRQLFEYLDRPASPSTSRPIDHPLRGYVQRLYESANQHLETAIIRLIDLDIEDSPEAVPARPQPLDDIALLFGDAKTETTFTTFAEAFAHFNRRALLLGEPGSGKTVTLMATARQAAADWLNDPDYNPLPILALISTWDSIKRPSLMDWLGSKKDLSPEPVHEVMKAGRALLLLDGLDELGAERTEQQHSKIDISFDPRQKFILAFNAGLGQNAALVTCRTEEYKAISHHISSIHYGIEDTDLERNLEPVTIGSQIVLDGAVTLSQLSTDQIRAYLSADPSLATLQADIDADDGLRQMSRTPLLLSYLAFGFRDRPEDLRDLKDLSEGDLRDAVFMSYMDKRYDREVNRLTKMGQKPPFTLAFIKEVLGRVAMGSAYTLAKKGQQPNYADALLKQSDFLQLLPDISADIFIKFCNNLHYLRQHDEGSNFIHLRLRDTLAYVYSIPRLRDSTLYDAPSGTNPATALGAIQDRRAIDYLISCLSDKTQEIRNCAIRALTTLNVSLIEPLSQTMKNQAPEIRIWCTHQLSQLDDPNAIFPLLISLKDVNDDVRICAAHALDQAADMRSMDALIQSLADPNSQVRCRCVKALERLRDNRTVEPLIGLLDDNIPAVRFYAASALGHIGDSRSVGPLESLVGDNARAGLGRVSDAAGYALRRIGTPEALKAYSKHLAMRSQFNRHGVARADKR